MVTIAEGSDEAEPKPLMARTKTNRVWIFDARDRGKRHDREQDFDAYLMPVLMVSDRDTIERRSRGLLGGAVQWETMMNVNYTPDTDHSASQSRAAKPATEARQGIISGRILLVLLVSMALVVAGMAIAFAVWGR